MVGREQVTTVTISVEVGREVSGIKGQRDDSQQWIFPPPPAYINPLISCLFWTSHLLPTSYKFILYFTERSESTTFDHLSFSMASLHPHPPQYSELPTSDSIFNTVPAHDFGPEASPTDEDLLSIKSTQPDSAALNYPTTTISKSQAPKTTSGINGYRSPVESSWPLLW
jgi:hypothetical protein